MLFNVSREHLPNTFRLAEMVRDELVQLCNRNSDIALHVVPGKSENGKSIDGFVLGSGSRSISLIAGSHSDEPVGPEALRVLIKQLLKNREHYAELLKTYRLLIIPQVNPDGEERNWQWAKHWPDLSAYLKHAFRELPGRDLEFGYPAMRDENNPVAEYLRRYSPIELHVSLHGMAFSEGAMLLIDKHWINRTDQLRQNFVQHAKQAGLQLHAHDRAGEKGFDYIAPGFTTTPRGRAMQDYFLAQDDAETAQKFHLSSMEFVRDLGGDPLCLVTELPLFLLENSGDLKPGVPENYLAFRLIKPELQQRAFAGEQLDDILQRFRLRPLDLLSAIALQLQVIEEGINAADAAQGA